MNNSIATGATFGLSGALVFMLLILLSSRALAFQFDGLVYEVLPDDTVDVTGRAAGSTDTDIVIPATVSDGSTTYSVTAIEGGAFNGNALTSVTIPDSVTTIGDGTFQNNKLTSVIIPGSVTKALGVDAFRDNALRGPWIFQAALRALEKALSKTMSLRASPFQSVSRPSEDLLFRITIYKT